MPELPEVETVRRVLVGWVKGKTIKRIDSTYPKIVSNVDIKKLNEALSNRSIDDIGRYGKFLLFFLDEKVLISHLRMEGKYYLAHYPKSNLNEGIEYDPINGDIKFNKHVHLVIEFTDGTLLLYHDVRKFGRFFLTNSKDYLKGIASPLRDLGVEPFGEKNGDVIYNASRKSRLTVKELLMGQHVVVGLGNIYVDEVCFLSKISPFKKASILTREECDILMANTIKVLEHAIELGGSTIRSYHFANDASGRFQNELYVYGREGEPCEVCGTPITKTKLGGRGTHFCSYCQRNTINKEIKVVGITGLIGSGKSTITIMFKESGYEVIDADDISRHCLDRDTDCYKKVVGLFGKGILNTDKTIDRARLREIVANDSDSLKKLDDIIHPEVIKKTKDAIKRAKGKCLLDVPLLFETKMNELCDLVVFVNTKESVRLERLKKRRTMSLKDANKLNAQALTSDKKIAKSDVVIDNSLDLEKTKWQVSELLKKIG